MTYDIRWREQIKVVFDTEKIRFLLLGIIIIYYQWFKTWRRTYVFKVWVYNRCIKVINQGKIIFLYFWWYGPLACEIHLLIDLILTLSPGPSDGQLPRDLLVKQEWRRAPDPRVPGPPHGQTQRGPGALQRLRHLSQVIIILIEKYLNLKFLKRISTNNLPRKKMRNEILGF